MGLSLSARHIVKRYGGVLALSDGNLEVTSGEVVALMGANGSGKSTLTKIITGVVAPNEGQLLIDNQLARFSHPSAAKRLGIVAVYQELSLIPDMTVAENIWLTHEPMTANFRLRGREMRTRSQVLLDLFSGTVGPALDPEAPIGALAPGERQIVEILKAISAEPRLLILDEATASLDRQQVIRLFDLIKTWKQQGIAIVFVSHRMEEIFRIADRTTVIRNGKTVYSERMENTTEQELIRQMIGDVSLHAAAHLESPAASPVRLRVEGLTAGSVRGVSLQLHDAELLGLGGLQGQGQTDLLLALFGAIPHTGRVLVDDRPVAFRHPDDAMQQGVAFVPGDRSTEGLLLIRSILDNLQLPSWARYGFPLRMPKAYSDATSAARDLNIMMTSLDMLVSSLSGGNAQKVVLGKWLMRKPNLLLLNDPTKGVDVGAKGEFYSLLANLRQSGTSILFYSSDDEELLNLCDRVLVLHDGRISAELRAAGLNHANLVAASMGTEQRL
ncbi:MAG TPA: sugar ABC transporter ATP-binding protein [Aggregatilineales bacterium]|nr:sugar ABC transporter ATP-binding protein [Aggregatilineales bacterium]